MRDKIKNKEYFEKFILNKSSSINELEKELQERILKQGEDWRADYVFRLRLADLQLIQIEAMYSLGLPLMDIKEVLLKMIENFCKSREKTGAHDQLLSTISMAILLGVDETDIKKLTDLISKIEFKDYLVDFLLHGLTPEWKIKSSKMKIPKPYLYIQDILNAETKEQAYILLKEFVEKKWYNGSRGYLWYNSHKMVERDTYSGYWCFVAGAVSKLLELDDTSLKDCQYYPYDMVHFND